ncbi:MAG: DUF106 domain-containing protein [Candidatus Heimdallarchaeota archaeon]|nr:DUF106 domain-containing protein [Candidatus Heimdallarchaeota archaeon]
MSIFSDMRDGVVDWLVRTGWTEPAQSTILLVIVSLIVSSISGLVNRAIIDMEKLNNNTQEMQAHQKRKKKAMETADKKLWISVKRNEDRFTELQRSTMTTRMLPSLVTFGPIIFVFTTLRAAFQKPINVALNGDPTCSNSCGVIAVLPFRVSRSIPLIGNWFSPYVQDVALSVAGFGFWYFLSAVVVSSLLQRLFGINLTGMQSPLQGGTPQR